MTTSEKDLVLIGEVVKPHGIRGEVSVEYHGDSPFLLDEVPVLLRARAPKTVAPAKGGADRGGKGGGKSGRGRKPVRPRVPRARRIRIDSWREHKGRLLMFFEGVADRDAAEALRGAELFVREADLPEPGEDELYLYAIEGLAVRLEDGTLVGHVREVQLLPAGQEVWAIDSEDGREVLFPVAAQFVLDVDLDEERVTIAPPEGLLDLYLSDADDEDE